MSRLELLLPSVKRLAFVISVGLIPFAVPAHIGIAKKGGIRCTLAQVQDSQRSGTLAFTYLVPDGWKSTSVLNWTGNSYIAEFNRFTPDRHYEVDTLEPMNTSYRAATNTAPQGTKLTKASDFLNSLVEQITQKGNVTNLQTVEVFNKDLPLTQTQNLTQGGRQIPSMTTSAFHQYGFLKVTFEMDGIPEVATMGTTVAGNLGLNHIVMGFGARQSFFDTEGDFYVVGPTLLVITPAKPTPAKTKEVQLVASSTRMTPQFAFFCAKLALAMSDAAFNATKERGKQLIADMQAQTAKNLQNFKNQMADRDATTHDFCNYISDQQDYKKSSGSIVTLPAYYNHSWADDQGHYVLTDDPTFDPKGTGGGNWEQMSKAYHGQ